jgi:hypothetical protein
MCYCFSGTSVAQGYQQVRVSTGPWLAGSLWSAYPVPCNCASGWCYSYCYVGTAPVRWGEIPASAACGPGSTVYEKWSGPLGYCSFPKGIVPPPPTSDQNPNGVTTGQNTFGGVPEGTTFNTPSQVPAVQGLAITACITLFFAAIAGCIDSFMDGGSMPAAGAATFCSFIAFVLSLTSYCLWSAFPYIQNLQGSSPASVWVPVWLDQGNNQLSAIQVNGFVYGPGWATALTASILIFFCFLVHAVSMKFHEVFPDGDQRGAPLQKQNTDNVQAAV